MRNANPWSRCTAQRSNGSFCDAPSIPDAPFPMCIKHAAEMFAFLRRQIEMSPGRFANAQMILHGMKDVDLTLEAETSVVYYIRIGDTVKIGTSINLANRRRSYGPTAELLATEPGGVALEAERLRQFQEYRVGGREWFNPGPRLMTHIEALQTSA